MFAQTQKKTVKSTAWLAPAGVAAAAAALFVSAVAAPSPAAADHHKGGYGYAAAAPVETQPAYGGEKSWAEKSWAERKEKDAEKSVELNDEELRNFGGVPIQGRKPSLLTRKRFLGGDN